MRGPNDVLGISLERKGKEEKDGEEKTRERERERVGATAIETAREKGDSRERE